MNMYEYIYKFIYTINIQIKACIQNAFPKPHLFKKMLYPIKSREVSENLEKLASLQNQVNDLRVQDNLGKEKFQDNVKNIYEPKNKKYLRKYSENYNRNFY